MNLFEGCVCLTHGVEAEVHVLHGFEAIWLVHVCIRYLVSSGLIKFLLMFINYPNQLLASHH